MSKRSATLPVGWTISAFAAHDAPGDLWICINTPHMGQFLRLCKKQNEIYMAVELMKHADGAGATHEARRWCKGDGEWTNWQPVSPDKLAERQADPTFEVRPIAGVRENSNGR